MKHEKIKEQRMHEGVEHLNDALKGNIYLSLVSTRSIQFAQKSVYSDSELSAF